MPAWMQNGEAGATKQPRISLNSYFGIFSFREIREIRGRLLFSKQLWN
jgi:hypothetical protein